MDLFGFILFVFSQFLESGDLYILPNLGSSAIISATLYFLSFYDSDSMDDDPFHCPISPRESMFLKFYIISGVAIG